MFITLLMILPSLLFIRGNSVEILDGYTIQNQECYKIVTKSATYFYQKEAGGFASILDDEGNDWISFKKSDSVNYPYSAANEYRGFPNMVYGGDDNGSGHPGFENCVSLIKNDSTILTETKNKNWKWEIVFHDSYLELNVIKIDTNRSYWVLYEGTPGGMYDSDNFYWGNSEDGLCDIVPDFYKGPIKNGNWQWAYFGTKKNSKVIFIAQKNSDCKNDMFGLLGNTENGIDSPDGMTVFGFGRDGINPMISSPNTFYLGFYQHQINSRLSHDSLSKYISTNIIK